MIRWIPLLTVLICVGCAIQYGHRNEQTLIDIKTVPPRLSYYVLLWGETEPLLQPTPAGLTVRNLGEFESFLTTQLQGLVSNTSPLNYTVGSYILAVRCPNGFRFQRFDTRPTNMNSVQLDCS
jgi:hypothetical protein